MPSIQQRRRVLRACLGLIGLTMSVAPALLGQATSITFSDLPDSFFFNNGGRNIGGFYSGVTFGPHVNGLSVSRFGGYNSAAYPPHSGDVAIWDPSDPGITIALTSPVQSVAVWYSSLGSITLQAYDQNQTPVASSTGEPNSDGTSGTATLLAVTGSNIASARITGIPGTFVLSSLTFGTSAGGAAPSITGVVNGASFLPGVAASTWITIQGTNLSGTTRTWGASDFVNGNLPTQLDGVSATVNGVSTYLSYISPTQLNVLAPDDPATGQAQVQVTNANGTSNNFAVNKVQVSPAFFLFTAKYPAAVHLSGTYVGPPALIAGANFAPAKPGETIMLFGTGFGSTTPPVPAGKLVTSPAPLASAPTVMIGGKPAQVVFAGVSGSGLDQLNVTVPADLPDGDAPLTAIAGGASTQANLSVTIQR